MSVERRGGCGCSLGGARLTTPCFQVETRAAKGCHALITVGAESVLLLKLDAAHTLCFALNAVAILAGLLLLALGRHPLAGPSGRRLGFALGLGREGRSYQEAGGCTELQRPKQIRPGLACPVRPAAQGLDRPSAASLHAPPTHQSRRDENFKVRLRLKIGRSASSQRTLLSGVTLKAKARASEGKWKMRPTLWLCFASSLCSCFAWLQRLRLAKTSTKLLEASCTLALWHRLAFCSPIPMWGRRPCQADGTRCHAWRTHDSFARRPRALQQGMLFPYEPHVGHLLHRGFGTDPQVSPTLTFSQFRSEESLASAWTPPRRAFLHRQVSMLAVLLPPCSIPI